MLADFAPRLRLRSFGTARVVEFEFCAGYPGGGSTISSAEGPRSVESPEPVTGGGDPDVGVTEGQAFDRVWDGVREPQSIFVARETKFQSLVLEPWAHCWGVLSSVDQHLLRNRSQLTRHEDTVNELQARPNN